MEHIGTMTAPSGRLTNTTSETNLKRASNLDTYRETVLLVVIDSFEASSQNATIEEQMQRANVWTDLLVDIVPENRLQDAFTRAFRTHTSPFPINAYDLKAAWEEIDKEEKRHQESETNRRRAENPVAFCEAEWNHLNAEGDIEIYLGVPPNGRDVVVPCDRCRSAAFYARYNEERAKFIADQPEMKQHFEKSIADVMCEMLAQAKAKIHERPQPKSAIGILLRAKINGGNKEILSRIIDHVKATR